MCRRTCACDAWVTMCVGFLNVISPIQSPQHGQPPHVALKTFDIASKPCPPDGDINLIDTQRQRKKKRNIIGTESAQERKNRGTNGNVLLAVFGVFFLILDRCWQSVRPPTRTTLAACVPILHLPFPACPHLQQTNVPAAAVVFLLDATQILLPVLVCHLSPLQSHRTLDGMGSSRALPVRVLVTSR